MLILCIAAILQSDFDNICHEQVIQRFNEKAICDHEAGTHLIGAVDWKRAKAVPLPQKLADSSGAARGVGIHGLQTAGHQDAHGGCVQRVGCCDP